MRRPALVPGLPPGDKTKVRKPESVASAVAFKRLSMAVVGCRWLSIVVIGCHWLSIAVDVCQWRRMMPNGCFMLSLSALPLFTALPAPLQLFCRYACFRPWGLLVALLSSFRLLCSSSADTPAFAPPAPLATTFAASGLALPADASFPFYKSVARDRFYLLSANGSSAAPSAINASK